MDFVSFAKRHIISKAYDQYIPFAQLSAWACPWFGGGFLFFFKLKSVGRKLFIIRHV